jgi:transcriptional regulator with XRE-family HTH domain
MLREKIYHRGMTQIPPSDTPGATLKRLREAKGLTQQALADKLGKSRTAVAAWEYGRAMSLRSRTAVAKFLAVDPEVLGPPWNPNSARPQHRRRAREEAAYLDKLRDLGTSGVTPSPVVVDPDGNEGVNLSPQASTQIGGPTVQHVPDADQFEKLRGFWCAMDPANRPALVHAAWTLASPAPAAAHTERGAKKSQG